MLFNSHQFVFLFFPIVLGIFFYIGKRNESYALFWLALSSFAFYAWSGIEALPLLIASVLLNYWFGRLLIRKTAIQDPGSSTWLKVAVSLNLITLAIFKYSSFIIGILNTLLHRFTNYQFPTTEIGLPVGISFYTFTQIAYLVDCTKGKSHSRSLLDYCLFVSYFPHLIAGPILHHAQLMPQFVGNFIFRANVRNLSYGLTLFTIGLVKKLLVADQFSDCVAALFNSELITPTLAQSWLGVLAYTLQIYFDFSGYSDMALGISKCFNIDLPINFNSPYKSRSIVEFWRTWHISLSTFLRDYLYIPLGGNRNGPRRRSINLFVTMLLGGLWHGANWTFVAWGAMHGALLLINHAWRNATMNSAFTNTSGYRASSWIVTLVSVCFAWAFFRAEDMTSALRVVRGMVAMNGVTVSVPFYPSYAVDTWLIALMSVAVVIALFLPNSMEIVERINFSSPSVETRRMKWIAYASGLGFGLAILAMNKVSPFLYFRF